MDARGTPQWVLPAHASNEFAQLTANPGPPWPTARFPAPIGPKPCSMPPQDRARLNNVGQTEHATCQKQMVPTNMQPSSGGYRVGHGAPALSQSSRNAINWSLE